MQHSSQLRIALRFLAIGALSASLFACSFKSISNAVGQLAGGQQSSQSFAQQNFGGITESIPVGPGPAARVCGDVPEGFVHCDSWVRTDIVPNLARPDFTPAGFGPTALRTAYGLLAASMSGGVGQTIGIVDAFDDPNAASDLAVYRSQFHLSACTVANGCFIKKKFATMTNAGWAAEISLDVDMASAICPNCHILLVEAKTNSITDLTTAEAYAVAHANAVSNSWSASESTPIPSIDNVYKSSTVAITASTGDSGFNPVANWPAILPTVVGVGGTSLTMVSPRTESAWSGAGSGCSHFYAKPAFQSGVTTGCTKRAQADISAVADPNTGVAVYDTFGGFGGWNVFGGTSVASPVDASIFPLVGNSATNNAAHIYANKTHLNDIKTGSNGGCGAPLCKAGTGWDGPTGLGTPNGTAAF